MNDISSEFVETAKAVVALDAVRDSLIDPLTTEDNESTVKCVSLENGKEREVVSDDNAKDTIIEVQNGSSEDPAIQEEPKDVTGETAAKHSETIEKSSENSPVENQESITTETVNELTNYEIEPQKDTSEEIESEITEVTETELTVPKVPVLEVTATEVSVPEVTVAEITKKSPDIIENVNSFQTDSKNTEESTPQKVIEINDIKSVREESKVLDKNKISEIVEIKADSETKKLVKDKETSEIKEKKVADSKPAKEKSLEVLKVPIFKEVKKLLEETIKPFIVKNSKENTKNLEDILENRENNIKNKQETESIRKTPEVTDTSDVEMVEMPVVEEKKILVEKLHVVEKAHVVEKREKPEAYKKKEGKMKQPVNGDIIREDHTMKRRASEEVETESPLKRLCQEVEKTFPQHDTMINEYIQNATKNNIDEIQKHTEQLLAEIQTLRELAQKKEHEWNNILHLKKVKEEILLRLLRRKQVLSFEKSADMNGTERADPFEYLNQAKSLAIDKSDEISGLSLKQPNSSMNHSPLTPIIQPVMPVTSHYNPMAGLPPPYDKAHLQNLQNMQKPLYQPMMMPGPMPGTMPGFPRDMNGQLNNAFGLPMGRQGPTKDVKSIIADYRQRNPDITPRRGRRMKSILNPNMMNNPRPIAPKVDAMNNLTNLNMLFNNLDMNQKAMLERLQQMQAGNIPNTIFKDALVQFASMQQASMSHRPVETITNQHKEKRRPEREEPMAVNIIKHPPDRMPSTSPRLPPPPPYPEISLLPVNANQEQGTSQNSLLHGILTKTPPVSGSYSPTLAKLLTSPERRQDTTLPLFGQAKNCGEITITPVAPAQPPPEPEKTEEVVQLDDEESPPTSEESVNSPSGSGRLVIDEANEDAPLCQGCRRKAAQFVCAGCANQWYCSRECQVAAWDDHSDMCSG